MCVLILALLNYQSKRVSFKNCRGLNRSLEFLQDFLKESSTLVLEICETFLDKTKIFQHFESCQFFHSSWKKNKRGGFINYNRDILHLLYVVNWLHCIYKSCLDHLNLSLIIYLGSKIERHFSCSWMFDITSVNRVLKINLNYLVCWFIFWTLSNV